MFARALRHIDTICRDDTAGKLLACLREHLAPHKTPKRWFSVDNLPLPSERNHATYVLAVTHVLISLVDLIEAIGLGHELVELELSGLIKSEQVGDVKARVAGPEGRP
jgi:hypothetical protein